MKNSPLAWSTLDEAAEWLAKNTGEQWTARRVLDAAIRYQRPGSIHTIVSAVLPPGHDAVPVTGDIPEDPGTASRYRRRMWRATPLTHAGAMQVLVDGATELWVLLERLPRSSGHDGTFVSVTVPPAQVGTDALGIEEHHLRGLLAQLRGDSKTPDPKKTTDKADDWKAVARAEAMHIRRDAAGRGCALTVKEIAEEVERKLRSRGITGPSGLPLSAETIKRHALAAITKEPL